MKGLGTYAALLCVSHTLQIALENEKEARIVQINFSAAFDRFNLQWILFKLCSLSIESSMLSFLIQFLFNGCQRSLVNVLSGVPQVNVGPLLFFLYTSVLFFILGNKLYDCIDDFTLVAVVPSLLDRVTELLGGVAFEEWALNASNPGTMIVSKSRTMHPQSTPSTQGWTVLEESVDLDILGVTFDDLWDIWC